MTINLKGDKLILTFRYNPSLLPAVKSIPGRKFMAKAKNWEVPADYVLDCLEILCPLGFTPTLEVKNLARRYEESFKKINQAKNNSESYKGSLPLYGFQRLGAAFLMASSGALLADAPGLGKTLQTLAAVEGEQRVLIFCPASLKWSWAAEIEKWQPKAKYAVVNGIPTQRFGQWRDPSYKYVIANYELLLHDFDYIAQNWDVIVCDEATRISNPAAQTTRHLKQLSSKRKIALTGTPISNSPIDIYSIIDWLAPGYLGSFWSFKNKYCILAPYFHNRVVGFKNLDELSQKISQFLLRRTKEEVLDLPLKTFENIVFDLSDKEIKLYNALKKTIWDELLAINANTNTLSLAPVKMLRLKQLTGWPQLLFPKSIENSKFTALKEVITPIIASGEKCLIFTQFAEVAKELQKQLNDLMPKSSLIIYGDVPLNERQPLVDQFNSGKNQIMIMTEAGAYGLNLQSASYVIHYDLPWSVAKMTQREDRAHRIGQTKKVTVYTLTAKNSIDEYVAKVLHKKQEISVELLQDWERLETYGMTEEDIKSILRL